MPKFAFPAFVDNATRWYVNARNDVGFPTSGQLTEDMLKRDWVEKSEAEAKAGTTRCVASINGSTQNVANQAAADKMASENPTATFYIIAAGMMNTDKDPAVPAKGYFIANNGVATLTQYLPA